MTNNMANIARSKALGECISCASPPPIPGLGCADSCSVCSSPPQTLSGFVDVNSGFGGFFDEIPWRYIVPTAIISAGASAFITWKLAKTIITGNLALKVSGLGKKKRKIKRGRRGRR